MKPGAAERARARQRRFEELVTRCEQLRPGGLGFDELRELARLYRAHVVTLSRARERGHDPEAVRTLNALCVRAYTHLVPTSPSGADEAQRSGRLLRALAATWRPQLLAWSTLALGILLGAALVDGDPRAVHSLIPAGLGYSAEGLERLVASPEARAEFFERRETPAATNILFGSMLFANNTRVGLLAFATGLLAGVPTVLLQVYNGLVLGGFLWIFFQDPWPVAFLAWIMPHGVPEFTAICLCAAAGLVLGGAVLLPGRRTRSQALRAAIDPALLLVGASIPFFVLAALIESFVRESALGSGPRLAVAALMVALVLGMLVAAQRANRRLRVETSWLQELAGPLPPVTGASGGQRPGASRISR
ncbi:MAG: hypothetical protein CL910_01790 [Deltaproteobacteria bacterium]|nr:hypothetical protein [Deltaproteobacteria bacterium]